MNFPQLTFTRFIAAILVVVYHFAANKPILQHWGGLERIIYIASTFVSYFFLLSGFILVVSDARAVHQQRVPAPARFWQNRFARIYPLFFGAFLLAIPRFYESNGTYPTAQSLIANALLLQAWIPLRSFAINFPDWSLSCEAFFYLLFPFILRRLLRLSTRMIAIFVVSAYTLGLVLHVALVKWGIAHHLVFTDHWFHDFVFHFPIFHLSTFVVGVGVGIIFVRKYAWLLHQATYWQWLAGGSLLIWLGLILTRQPLLIYHHNGLLTPLYLLMLIGLSVSGGWLIRLLAAKPLVWLGEISYGVYVLQLPVYWLVNQPWMPTWGGIGPASMYMYIPLLVGTAGFCHRFIEIPAKLRIRILTGQAPLLAKGL